MPLSVLSNWLAEIEKFCPSFRAVRFHGPKSERARIKSEELSDTKEFDIVVTTFEMLVSEVNFFKRKYVWTTIIVDEGHRLKVRVWPAWMRPGPLIQAHQPPPHPTPPPERMSAAS